MGQKLILERAMASLEEKAKEVLLRNYAATGQRYICPSWPHYRAQFFWDSCFQAITSAHLGMLDLARNEIERLLSFQDSRGFIPFFIYESDFRWYVVRDWKNWERFLWKGLLPRVPPIAGVPVIAQAVRAIGDSQFFLRYADKIIAFYKYFSKYRDPDHDGLISIITPREGGRDSGPEYDFFHIAAVKMPWFLDTTIDILSLLRLEARYKLMGWDEKRIFASHIFDVQDLLVQCAYIDGLYDLVWMMEGWDGSCKRYPDIKAAIGIAEQAVLKRCWNKKDKAFYSLRDGKEQLRDLTVASLFPLLINNLPKHHTNAIVEALLDKSKFNVPYPIPCVSRSHPDFNPKRHWPLWRGPTWINTNWFLIRGLLRNGEVELAKQIAKSSIEMVVKSGFREFYNPLTGEGLRTKNFGWSTLAITFEKLVGLEK